MDLRALLALLAPPSCTACGRHAGRAEPLCPACRAELTWLPRSQGPAGHIDAWAPLAHCGPARDLVAGLKYGGAVANARTMAAHIAVRAPRELVAGVALVPVPSHPRRLRERGYNPAELIASQLALRSGAPVLDCLERHGPPQRQVGRDRDRRAAQIAGRIGATPGTAGLPHAVVIVDDVITTGATASACAAALAAVGVRHVRVLAYTRASGR